jgi:hypothetical protein
MEKEAGNGCIKGGRATSRRDTLTHANTHSDLNSKRADCRQNAAATGQPGHEWAAPGAGHLRPPAAAPASSAASSAAAAAADGVSDLARRWWAGAAGDAAVSPLNGLVSMSWIAPCAGDQLTSQTKSRTSGRSRYRILDIRCHCTHCHASAWTKTHRTCKYIPLPSTVAEQLMLCYACCCALPSQLSKSVSVHDHGEVMTNTLHGH